MAKTLQDRISDGIRETLTNLLVQTVQLQAEKAELLERVAALEAVAARTPNGGA